MVSRPSKDDLEAARDRVLPDLLRPGLRVVFCGINPGLWSAATGHHFARPGNRFWPALHAAGLTPRQLDPSEQEELLRLGLGLTNVVPRASARADELTQQEYVEGGAALRAKVEEHAPAWLAVLGVTAYRAAFGDRTAQVGEQDVSWGPTRLWVLPNPSGLNAHWPAAALADEFRRLGRAAGVVRPDRAHDVGSAGHSGS